MDPSFLISKEWLSLATKLFQFIKEPDCEVEAIKKGYLKLISGANDYIYIQTPYLIPDDSVLEALVVAKSVCFKV